MSAAMRAEGWDGVEIAFGAVVDRVIVPKLAVHRVEVGLKLGRMWIVDRGLGHRRHGTSPSRTLSDWPEKQGPLNRALPLAIAPTRHGR